MYGADEPAAIAGRYTAATGALGPCPWCAPSVQCASRGHCSALQGPNLLPAAATCMPLHLYRTVCALVWSLWDCGLRQTPLRPASRVVRPLCTPSRQKYNHGCIQQACCQLPTAGQVASGLLNQAESCTVAGEARSTGKERHQRKGDSGTAMQERQEAVGKAPTGTRARVGTQEGTRAAVSLSAGQHQVIFSNVQ